MVGVLVLSWSSFRTHETARRSAPKIMKRVGDMRSLITLVIRSSIFVTRDRSDRACPCIEIQRTPASRGVRGSLLRQQLRQTAARQPKTTARGVRWHAEHFADLPCRQVFPEVQLHD